MIPIQELFKSLDLEPIFDLQKKGKAHVFDFAEENTELHGLNLNNQIEFESFINSSIKDNNADYGIGRYAEDRILYRRFKLFEDEKPRSFHLGIDIWLPAGSAIMAPLDGVIHSFADNHNPGDYGPTIILEHSVNQHRFYTLYGHLSRKSMIGIHEGMSINAGHTFCELGKWEENVFWPPHLHLQIILDIREYKGDYPGVCLADEKNKWMENSPDPNTILKLE